jgi:FG-GAP-like repeat
MSGLKHARARGLALFVGLFIGGALLPAAAEGGTGFTFVLDPAQPSLPGGSVLDDVAELTGNGIPDLVIVNAERNAVGVMLGNGAGGFGAPTWYPVAGHPAFIRVADFNDDGYPDLLVLVETVPPVCPVPTPFPTGSRSSLEMDKGASRRVR